MKNYRPQIHRFFIYILLFFYTLVSLYPVIWMAFFSLKNNLEIFVTNPFGPPQVPQWNNYVRAVSQFPMALFFRNSIVVSLLSMFFGISFALMFTYVVARVRNGLTKTLHSLIMLGMFIPIQAVMIPLVVMIKNLGLINTWWSLIVPYTALSFPFAVMVLYGFYLGLPKELEESAYIDGAGFFRSYFHIILPQMRSAVMILLIYQFMTNWNEFSLALILITRNTMKTLPLGLAGFWGTFSTDWGPIGAALIIASLPVIVLYIFFSNQISDAMAYSGIKN